MLVGMCPGYDENRLGRPFIGRSGQLLRKICDSTGFNQEDLYFSNVVKCRLTDAAGKNREPSSKEMKTCGQFLLEEIQELDPKLIVLLGETALKFFFNKSISKYRGMILKKGDYKFFVTFHPAYLLRNSRDMGLWEGDFNSIHRIFYDLKREDGDVEKVLCATTESVDFWFDKILSEADRYVLDIEAWAPGEAKEKKALDPWAPGYRLLMISFSYFVGGKCVAVCIPLDHPESNLDFAIVSAKLNVFFKECHSRNIKLIGQNVKFDLKVLQKILGIDIKSVYFDTMIGHSLISNTKSGHSLERMSIDLLGVDSYKEVLHSSLEEQTIVPLKELSDMNMDDCINTLRLSALFESELKSIAVEQDTYRNNGWNIWSYHNKVVMPGMQVLKKMELRGMPVNLDYLKGLDAELDVEVEGTKKRIYSYPELANSDLSLTSNLDLNKILFDVFGFEPPGKKNKIGYPVDKEALEKLEKRYHHPIISDLLEFKLLSKLRSTYVRPYILKHVKSDGRVHGTFNLHISRTGRLSMENPNIQNIPVRIGPLILEMFQAYVGWYILVADFSQIELRVMAAASKDPAFREAFATGKDIHASTAAEVNAIPIDQVTPKQRYDAKAINFGIIYGMGDDSLAETLGISVSDAHVKREGYLDTYKGVRTYMDARKEDYKKRGFVETLFGKRIYIFGGNEGHNERRAINGPIQGTASDINQMALILIDGILESKGMKSGAIDVIHDSQVYEVCEEELEEVKDIVTTSMEGLELSFMEGIPLKVDIGVGKDLGAAMLEKD